MNNNLPNNPGSYNKKNADSPFVDKKPWKDQGINRDYNLSKKADDVDKKEEKAEEETPKANSNIGFFGTFKSFFKNFFNFKGKAGVKEFWFSAIWSAFITAAICLAISMIDNYIFRLLVYGFFRIPFLALYFLCMLSVTCRRFNDAGAKWFTPIIPICVGMIALTVVAMLIYFSLMVQILLSIVILVLYLSTYISMVFALISLVLCIIICSSKADKFKGKKALPTIYVISNAIPISVLSFYIAIFACFALDI